VSEYTAAFPWCSFVITDQGLNLVLNELMQQEMSLKKTNGVRLKKEENKTQG